MVGFSEVAASWRESAISVCCFWPSWRPAIRTNSPTSGSSGPARRYTASIAAGLFYVLIGLAGGAVAILLTAFPRELVAAIAGLALLGTIAGALATALKDEGHRDAAILTFLVCLSGISVFGIGAAFWGVVAGGIATIVTSWRRAAV